MRKLNLPILQILITLGIGIIMYDYLQVALVRIISIAVSLVILLILLHTYAIKKVFSEIPFILTLSVLFITLGYLTRERANDLRDSQHYMYSKTTNSQTILFSIEETLKPTRYYDKYIVKVKKIQEQNGSGRILLNVSKDSLSQLLRVGEWYYVHNDIQSLPKPKNPYQFDYGAYLERKEIFGQLSLPRQELLKSDESSEGPRVWSSRFRESVQRSLRSYPFSKQQLSIIEALVLGQKQGIDKEMNAQYAAAGMMHILAVSGLHVGIVLLLLRFLLKPVQFYRLKWAKSGIIILLIWSFAFITGLSPSVMRAATMFTFLEIGSALGGKRKSRDAVLVSAVILLLYDPMLLYQVGFQLSYLAVLAILWVQPWLEKFWTPKYKVINYLWGIATVTIAAQIGVMPLSLFYFHQFPGLFFISNIVILPFLGVILGGGIVVSILAVVGLLPDWLVLGYGSIIDLMNGFIGWVARQESFVSTHISMSLAMLLVTYFLLVSIIALLRKYSITRYAVAVLALLIATGVWLYEKSNPPSPHIAILNKNRVTAIVSYNNEQMSVQTNDSLFDLETDYRINAYRDALVVNTITVDSLRNFYSFQNKELLLVDELGIYNVSNVQPDYILLTGSPKINLDRLLTIFPEASIIADASNYKSYVDRWQTTCLQRKIPFHSTYEKGAFIIY